MNPVTWVGLASAVLGAGAGTSKPATPSMSSVNPVMNSIFDGSGWAINFAGTQNATSTTENKQSGEVAGTNSAPGGTFAGMDSTMLMMLGGLVLVVLWMR